jgi:amidohydrolase
MTMPGAPESQKRQLIETIDKRAQKWRELALKIHAHPEIGLQEVKASAWLSEALEGDEFSVTRGIADLPTSFLAGKSDNRGAPTIGFLAEYDALPGLGHACSHNLMGCASCLAAVGLAQVADPKDVNVRVYGTPAEENFGGKAQMVERGSFAGVDIALMAHGGYKNYGGRAFIGVRSIVIEFHGKAAHASVVPHQGINALDAMIQTFSSVGLLRQQLPETTRIHGIITDGGKAANIIPDYTRAEFMVRAFSLKGLDDLENRLSACARGAAEATGAKVTVSRGKMLDLPPNKRVAAIEEVYENNLRFLDVQVDRFIPGEGTGSTDFCNVSQVLPGLHAYFKICEENVKSHTPEFAEAARSEKGLAGMVVAAKALALTALDFVSDRNLWDSMREQFKKS